MTSDYIYRFLTFWTLALVIGAVAAQDYNLDDNIKELIARRKNIEFMRQLVEDMDDSLTRLQKRTCLYNAGMSHNCDYKMLNEDKTDQGIWIDEKGPGKRKRSSEGKTKEDMRTFLRSMKALATNHKRR